MSAVTEHWAATETVPDLAMDGGDFDDWFDGGGDGDRYCQWDEGICMEVPSYYVVSYCDDPDCEADHTSYFCMRHYALYLARKLEHLHHCPGYADAHSPQERRLVTLRHIAAWGHIAGIQ